MLCDCDGDGCFDGLVLHAVSANATHGLRRTNADKRRAVMALLYDDEWAQWSDREIARRCAVDGKTVARLRAELTAELPQMRLVERGGTTEKPVDRATNTSGNAPVVGEVTTVDLAHELELVKVRAELAVAMADADGLRQRLEDATRRLRDLELLVGDTRQERDDWRDRHDAREAELRVLQGDKGLPWWRKLIGTRPVYELPDSMIEAQ